MTRHFPCCDSSFDLARVKTEVEDSEQNVQTSTSACAQSNAPITAADRALNIGNVKTEVKSEIPEVPEIGYSGATVTNAIVKVSSLNLHNNGIVSHCRGRGRGGGARGSRGKRGGQRGGIQGTLHKSHKLLPATKNRAIHSVSLESSSLMNYMIPGLYTQSKQANILPKTANIGYGNGLSKKDIVNIQRSFEVINTSSTAPRANAGIPNTFTVNNLPGPGGSLTGANVSALPFNSFILNNNILTNTQQDTLFVGGSAALINPLPGSNTLHAPGLVPGFQPINMAQPLANFPNLNIAPNQNTALGIHQNIAQVFNSETQNGTIFTGNMNQSVNTVVASTVPPSQQMSYKVAVLIDNQIILMDMPAQYPTAVSLANPPISVSLPSFGQSLGMFSSAMTPTADTRQATACIVSTALPCNGVSANNIHPPSDVTATTLHITPHLQPQPVTANIIGAQGAYETTKTLKSPPPLVLAGSTVSQHQSQDGTTLLLANNDRLCSETTASNAEMSSSKTKLQMEQHMKNQRMEVQSNVSSTNVNSVSQLQSKDFSNSTNINKSKDVKTSVNNNKELHYDKNVPDAQKNTPHSKLPVGPVTKLTVGTESVKTNMAPVTVKAYSLNNKTLSSVTSKPNIAPKISADLKSSSNVKTVKRNVLSLKMETPDTIERKMFPSGKEAKNQSLEIKNPEISDNAGTEEQQMIVKGTLQSKTSNSVENMVTSCESPQVGHHLIRPGPKCKLHLRRLPFPVLPGKKISLKESVDKTNIVQPSSQPTAISAELLPKQEVNNDQSYASVDDSDKSESNDDVICKISEVVSIADVHPQSQPLLLMNNKCNGLSQNCNDLNSAQGTVFVGPLTKEQLDVIIQNPLELGKYVSVPSGHVLSSKAIVVPAASSASLQSASVPKKIAPAPVVRPCTPCGYPESLFVKIRPKPKIHLNPTCLPSSSVTTSVTTNTSSSTVTSLPQATVLVMSSSFSTSSTMPKTSVDTLATASDKDIGGKKRLDDGEKLDVKSSLCSSEICKDEKVSTHKHEYELECNTTQDSRNSSIMKLSFNGDLNLLKDALRKTTVELETLDSKTLVNTVSRPSSDTNGSSEREMSDSSEDEYKPKSRKRQWYDNDNIVLTRNKEKGLVDNTRKRWVPLEVVGDLAIRGRLLEGEFVDSGESDSRRIRRSDRISAKPRLDYADLERLPFQDLDNDIEELDSELYTLPMSPHSQPPHLSPILDHLHSQEMLVDDITSAEEVETKAQKTDDTNHLVLTSQGIKDIDDINSISSEKDFEDCYYSSESESDMFEPCDKSLDDAGKKKMMWKRHSEITLFLVKHSDRFHSDDEKGQHYCNICCQYKTGGIFRLSHHLKKHLLGALKCSQCDFEACHEERLVQHRKTRHAL